MAPSSNVYSHVSTQKMWTCAYLIAWACGKLHVLHYIQVVVALSNENWLASSNACQIQRSQSLGTVIWVIGITVVKMQYNSPITQVTVQVTVISVVLMLCYKLSPVIIVICLKLWHICAGQVSPDRFDGLMELQCNCCLARTYLIMGWKVLLILWLWLLCIVLGPTADTSC